ncbi:LuxR C-terminal-related transcriptional regulator [Streptomyces xanthophaeus]|uniref:LuxR C-terminal-related transcriptional regulator n=1 Tax=Streptomyces xanthophaeus TaxID=67385 RepID=UPI003691340E
MRSSEYSTGWPFVGRDRELDAWRQAWSDARCRSTVIFGNLGVGKSRLAEEFLNGTKDATVVRATATAAAAAIPLGAIAHLIPSNVDLSDPVKAYAAIVRALAGPQRDRRWIILIDDLHLLDAASAVLLQQLLDAEVIRLIATVRVPEPVSASLVALTQGFGVHRIDLAPFNEEQTEQLLQRALDGPVGHRTVHTLFERSAGNLLVLREIVLSALEAGELTNGGEIWELARGALPSTPLLAELIDARIAAADPAARSAMELLALCEPLSLTDLQSVAPMQALVDLDNSGLIRIRQDRRRTTISFAHSLYGEALRRDLSRLHSRDVILQHIERVEAHGARRHEDALHLVAWRLAATGIADPRSLAQAAELARHAHDYYQVVALLDAMPQDVQTYETLYLHGASLIELGEWQRADRALSQAEKAAPGEAEMVSASLMRSANLFWIAGQTAEALEVNEASRLKAESTAAQHALTLHEASIRTITGQPEQGLALLQSLESDPHETPALDPVAWAVAAMCKTAGLSVMGRTIEAISWGRSAYSRGLQLDEQAHKVPHPASQQNPLIFALSDAGQLAAAREIAQRTCEELVEADASTAVWTFFFRGRAEWLAGDVAAARRWYAEAISLGRARHYMRPLSLAAGGLAASAAVLGDFKTAETAVAEIADLPEMGFIRGEECLGMAWLQAGRGHLDQARNTLADAADRAHASGYLTSEMLLLTDIARLGGAKDIVKRVTSIAKSYDGSFASARAQFVNALAEDNPHNLLTASGELESIGANLLAAEAASAAAALWRKSGETRRATASALRADSCVSRCKGARTPLLVNVEAVSALTVREREVALLAAKRTPSREIAASLHLSVRTVNNHLQHIYTKLGVSTRRGLAESLGEE